MMKQANRILVATGAWLVLTSVLALTQGRADEGIQQVGLNARQKSAVVGFLKQRIAKHKKMKTADEIIADLSLAAAHNRTLVAQDGSVDLSAWDHAMAVGADQMKTIADKDVIIAMETAELQNTMSSNNFMFGITRLLIDDNDRNCRRGHVKYDDGGCSGEIVLLVFTIPLDIAFFPFEFIASAVSGF